MSMKNEEQMKKLGIKIQLTKKGLRNLSLMLGEGCPFKIIKEELKPISCNKDEGWTCYNCWYQWLYRHAELIKEDE
jgi:hypothetical protein